MKKVLKPIMIAALALPTFAFADTTTAAKVQQAHGATTAPAAQANVILRYKVRVQGFVIPLPIQINAQWFCKRLLLLL